LTNVKHSFTLAHMIELKTAPTNVRLPPSMKDRALRLAQMNDISISDIVRLAVIKYLPEMERGEFVIRGVAREQEGRPSFAKATEGKR